MRYQYPVHFWRTTYKAEVEFVIDRGKDLIGNEVRFVSFFNLHEILKDLISSFETIYQVQERKFAYKFLRKKQKSFPENR